MTGAAADGATLVLRFSGVPERYAQISSDEIQADLKPVACNVDGYRRAIDGGNPLRFELSTTGGQDLPPVTVSEC